MDTAHIVRYIDDWLSENTYYVDSRIVDFALDIRLMLTGELIAEMADDISELEEPVGV